MVDGVRCGLIMLYWFTKDKTAESPQTTFFFVHQIAVSGGYGIVSKVDNLKFRKKTKNFNPTSFYPCFPGSIIFSSGSRC